MRALILQRGSTCFLASLLFAVLLAASPAISAVLTGPLTDVPESTGSFCWGDGSHDLCQQWSIRNDNSGWFYGVGGFSNVSIYIAHGLSDPTTVMNAESFLYSNSPDFASEGDTVFFRSLDGYYGAWRIDRIDADPPSWTNGKLTGQWYFQDDQSGCFAQDCTPLAVESSTWGAVKALYR